MIPPSQTASALGLTPALPYVCAPACTFGGEVVGPGLLSIVERRDHCLALVLLVGVVDLGLARVDVLVPAGCSHFQCVGCVQGSGFRGLDSGFRVQGPGFNVRGVHVMII